MIVNKIEFPKFTGVKCNMMPFIQGDSSSLPDEYKSYSKIVEENYIEKGEVGYLTIDESFVSSGESQRGYNSKGINRNVHIEVGRCGDKNRWGGSGGGSSATSLDDLSDVSITSPTNGQALIYDNGSDIQASLQGVV